MSSSRQALAALALVLLLPGAAAAEAEQVFAVVVGNNRSTDAKLPILKYADDDAARFAELFNSLGGQVSLLTVLDPTSQGRHQRLRATSRPPTRAQLLATLGQVFAQIRAAQARGATRTVFYFFFSGHGSVDQRGQGVLHLLDGTLSRGELFRHVVAASPARVNHLIIDACQAYFMVHAKGRRRGDRARLNRRLLDRFLRNERLESYPNTGVLLATAASAETHEWSRIQAGLFSHQVRSALLGAADVGHDGVVTYPEVAAYIAAANRGVKNRRAAPVVFARPPAQDLSTPVVRLGRRPLHRLRLARSLAGRFHLEDRRGLRYADFNKSAEAELTLILLRPGGRYFLRDQRGELSVELTDPPRTVHVARLAAATMAARGAIEDALRRGLYSVPFGPSFYAGYLTAWQRQLEQPLPQLAQTPGEASGAARVAAPPRWRLDLAYQLTRPALDRPGLAHGVALAGGYRLLPWLDLGLSLDLALASDGDLWRQQRVAASLWADAGWSPRPWIRLGARLGLGYLALLERVNGADRGDPAAFALQAHAGPELRLHPRLWLSLRGGALLDVYSRDGQDVARVAPLFAAGLSARF